MQQNQNITITICVILINIFLKSCVEESLEEESQTQALVSRGIITASLNRHIESAIDTPFESFNLTGVFARYLAEEGRFVSLVWGQKLTELDLALDSCNSPAPILKENQGERSASTKHAVELLDVGDLTVKFDNEKRTIPTRTFPDLLKIAVGVIYSANELQGVSFRPSTKYDIRTTGSDDVEVFRVQLDSPADLGTIRVDGLAYDEETPIIIKGKDVLLTWEGDGYGDEVIASIGWTIMGSPWEITCRMKDDGEFLIPSSITKFLPDSLTASDENIFVRRYRQVAFRSAGLSNGSFQFVVSSDFPIKF